jgi:hypothetical protein
MEKVYCIYEDNHGMIGIAKDYSSAIDGLVKEKWLDNDTEILDDNNNPSTVKEIFGEEWVDLIKHWDKDIFNISFEGCFWISTMEIWGS